MDERPVDVGSSAWELCHAAALLLEGRVEFAAWVMSKVAL
jgi:hypothetical protein